MARQNVRFWSSWPELQRKKVCGVAEFASNEAETFVDLTAEVNRIDVSAIGEKDLQYSKPPVDIEIDKDDPVSWRHGLAKAALKSIEISGPTANIIQHEYGIYADTKRGDIEGERVLELAERCMKIGPTIVQGHTLETKPIGNETEKFEKRVRIIRDLAEIVDYYVVPTRRGLDIATSSPYNINRDKLVHIDHGIRLQELDRKEMKEWAGFQDVWLAVTLGLKSPSKGIHEGIGGWGEFVAKSLTRTDRKYACYLVAGIYHPGFAENKAGLEECEEKNKEALKKYNLKSAWTKSHEELRRLDKTKYDIVFHNVFLDDDAFRRFYGAANVVILPYQNLQQISSGILADATGSRRSVIATKFPHALDLVVPQMKETEGLMYDKHSRGVCYDMKHPEQIRQGLEIVSDESEMYGMEDRSALRSEQMAWPTIGRQIIGVLESIRKRREVPRGRGRKMRLKKK